MASLSQTEPQPDQGPRFVNTLIPAIEEIPLPSVELIPLPSEPGPQPDVGEVSGGGNPGIANSEGPHDKSDPEEGEITGQTRDEPNKQNRSNRTGRLTYLNWLNWKSSMEKGSTMRTRDRFDGDDVNNENEEERRKRQRKKWNDYEDVSSDSDKNNARRLSGRQSRERHSLDRRSRERHSLERRSRDREDLSKSEKKKLKKKARSRSRSSSRDRNRQFHGRNRSKSKSRNRRLSSGSRERKKKSWKRSKSRDQSRSLTPPNRRHSSYIGEDSHRSIKKKKEKKKDKGWNNGLESPAINRRRRRSTSRSPSIILERGFSPSSLRKRRRGRSMSPLPQPHKRMRETNAIDIFSKKSKKWKRKNTENDDDVIVEKTVRRWTTGVTKPRRQLNVVGGTSYLDDDISLVNAHVSSEIADKEVFASGDKIMVSVNFRSNHREPVTSPKESRKTKVTEKPVSRDVVKDKIPVCVIDVRQSPYRIVENYPDDRDIVDVCSDDEKSKKKGVDNNDVINQRENKNQKHSDKNYRPRTPPPCEIVTQKTSSTPKKSPEKQYQQQPPQQHQQHQQHLQHQQHEQNVGREPIAHTGPKGPCTPPPLLVGANEVTRGPQTPSEPHDESFKDHPASPDKSFEIPVGSQSNNGYLTSQNNVVSNSSVVDNVGKDNNAESMFNSLLSTAAKALPFLFEGGVGSTLNNGRGSGEQSTSHSAIKKERQDKMDSPVNNEMDSPWSSGSESSVIFASPTEENDTKGNEENGNKASAGNQSISDRPSSSVEISVKEKFLKKVQRQERAVLEIKKFLLPQFRKGQIGKEAYKEIMRKCVPKVCHSKVVRINPVKLETLVMSYVKKYSSAAATVKKRSK